MVGLGALLFLVSEILDLVLVYTLGMGGWIAGSILVVGCWTALAFLGWGDPADLALEALCSVLGVWMTLRWTMRHQDWQKRITKDRREGEEKKQQVLAVVQDLREKITLKSQEVDRGLKQYELIKRLAEAVSWEEMAPSLERALKHFFHVEGWALYLTNEQGELKLIQRRGATPEPRAEDLPKKEPFVHTFVVAHGHDQGRTVWAMGMPLWRLHERIGLLILRIPDNGPERVEDNTVLLAEASTFSVQLIFAMAKAKLYRELDERSRTDGLTGLSRRGPFEERLKEEVARARSFRSTFSILMIDIDHFKRLNDGYGHQVGDEVLRTVSQRLREGLYETDVIARYGGEEFVCLLPRSDPSGLRIKAEQIRQRVSAEAFIIGLEAVTVTVSIGIAHFPADGNTAESVMAAADRALYAAKDAGRNCVVEAARDERRSA